MGANQAEPEPVVIDGKAATVTVTPASPKRS